MKTLSEQRRRRIAVSLMAALGGGTVFGGCEVRIKEAAVDGTTASVLQVISLGASGIAGPFPVSFTIEPYDESDGEVVE